MTKTKVRKTLPASFGFDILDFPDFFVSNFASGFNIRISNLFIGGS